MTKTNTDNRTEERRNRFNGESIMLNKEEARSHDCIFLAEIMATLEDKTLGTGASNHLKTMRKHFDFTIGLLVTFFGVFMFWSMLPSTDSNERLRRYERQHQQWLRK